MMVKRLYFLFILLISVNVSIGQEYFEINKVVKNTINYGSLPDAGFGKKMFNIIGLDNNMSINKIELLIKSRLLLKISRNKHQTLTAKISLTPISISGNTTLQNFAIDTLLWPSYVTVKLTFYNSKHNRGTLDITLPTAGKLKTVDLSNKLPSNIGDISANITNIQYGYYENKYIDLQRISEDVGNYYSYGTLLSQLIKQQSINNQVANQLSAKVFIDKIVIDRIIHNIKTLKLDSTLHLIDNDPIGFLKLTKKLHRLSHRTTTLFNQHISSIDTDSLSWINFCLAYCNVSSNYLYYAKALQPSDASAFEDIAQIYDSKTTKKVLHQIAAYYTQNEYPMAINTGQKIFNLFVNMADVDITENNYTEALLLLNNALIIHNWFSTILTSKYYKNVSTALDGVASSFLKVGEVALSANNQALADVYFNKADNIVSSNEKIFESLQNTDTAFSEYLGLQHKIASQYINNRQFAKAITRLSYGTYVCSRLNKPDICYSIDSAICTSYSGLITALLDTIDSLIVSGQYPDAFMALDTTNKYIYKNSCFIEDDNARFLNLCYLLFNRFVNNGELLVEARQSEMALYNLLKAKSMQTNYHLDTLNKLDNLIKFAAEPEITKLIDDAKYHTWANRMQEANKLFLKAVKLNKQYFNQSNIRINNALTDLDNQMSSRKCITFKTKYSDIIKRVHIAIKYNNYENLDTLFSEAQEYISRYPDCNINNKELIELQNKYALIIEFYREYKIVAHELFYKGYKAAIEKYVSLVDFYIDNNLSDYKIVIPDIKTFIKTQNLLNLTTATARYYLEKEEFKTSFEYIEIYRKQGGDAKNIKQISNVIAKHLAKNDNIEGKSVKDAIHEYTDGDGWYNSFKIAYLKNRIVN